MYSLILNKNFDFLGVDRDPYVNKTTQSKGKYDPDYIKYRFIALGINIVLV